MVDQKLLIIGSAPVGIVKECVAHFAGQAFSLLLPEQHVAAIDDLSIQVIPFKGRLSMRNFSFLKTMFSLRPDRVVIVVGETYFHDRLIRALRLVRKIAKPSMVIEIHRDGRNIFLEDVEREKRLSLDGQERILVLGTAPREVIGQFLETHDLNDTALLLQEKDTAYFTGRNLPTRYFRKTLSWFNPGCVAAIREFKPTRAVILVGKSYFHDNVVKYLVIQQKLMGREIAIKVHQAGKSTPLEKSQYDYSIPSEFRRAAIGILGALIVHALRPFKLIRISTIWATRLGHFTMDSELYLCRKTLGLEPDAVDLLYYSPNVVSNQTIAALYREKMFVRDWVRYVNEFLDILPGADKHRFRFQPGFSRDPDCHFQKLPPHIEFSPEQVRFGEAEMRKWGVDPAVPTVLVSGRDNAYLANAYPEKDFYKHHNDDFIASSCRNMDIRTLEPAVERMLDSGYQVLRMGSHVERPLQVEHERFFDYSLSGKRTDFMDIFILSRCSFFFGAASGILAVPMVFRRPCAYINLIRLEHIHTWDPRELTIFKRIWLVKEKRFMTMSEYMESNAGDWELGRYLDPDIELVDNTAEQIRDLAVEMEQLQNGNWQSTEEDEELQRRFWSFFKPGPLNYCFNSRIGTRFLRECEEMLK